MLQKYRFGTVGFTATMLLGTTEVLRTNDPDWMVLELALQELKTKFGSKHRLFEAIDVAFAGKIQRLSCASCLPHSRRGTHFDFL